MTVLHFLSLLNPFRLSKPLASYRPTAINPFGKSPQKSRLVLFPPSSPNTPTAIWPIHLRPRTTTITLTTTQPSNSNIHPATSAALMSYFDKVPGAGAGAGAVHLEPPPNPSHSHSLTKIESSSNSTLYLPSEHDPASRDDYPPSSDHPFSPFYSHPATRTSLEQKKSESKVRFQLYEHDLEAGSRATQFTPNESAQHGHPDDQVWPSDKVRKQQEAMVRSKKHGSYSPFKRMNKKQKFWVKVLIAVVIVGAITGLGVGITKAVGGGVFRTSSNSSAPIGDNEKH